jgi:hypothetical protein
MFNINSLSLLVMNSSSIPNFDTSSRIIMSTSCSIIIDSRYSINIAYFDSLSIIVSIISILVLISRSSKGRSLIIKSIITTCYFFIRAKLGYSFL